MESGSKMSSNNTNNYHLKTNHHHSNVNADFYMNGNEAVDIENDLDANDFYNDDFYDYKDTFIGKHKNDNNGASNRGAVSKKTKTNDNYVYEDDEYDDENNDGPLAFNIKSSTSNKKETSNRGILDPSAATAAEEEELDDEDIEEGDYNGDDNLLSESQFFHKEQLENDDDEEMLGNEMMMRVPKNNYNYNPDEDETHFNKHPHNMMDDDDEENLLMMDTFFKRVDSCELISKPKKAKIVNNYLIGEVLGDGSYGKVKECIDMANLTRRAVKIINLKTVQRKIPRGLENVKKEINIMKKLDHKNVIKLYDTFEKGKLNLFNTNNSNNLNSNSNANNQKSNDQEQAINDNRKATHNTNNHLSETPEAANVLTMINLEKPPKLYIFMDYCMTSLEKLLKTAPNQRLCNWQANFYFKQLIDGLEYLHSINVIHNDIKPGNLLITCDDTLKLCDFSVSAEIDPFCELNYTKNKNDESMLSQTSSNDNNNNMYEINPNLLINNGGVSSSNRFPITQCTPMFQCPEMLVEDMNELLILKNATKIDIWSSGITLFQLTTGELPFLGNTIHQIFENIRSSSNNIKIPAFIDKNLSELLNGMLNKNPLERWSIKNIRDCEWFKRKHPIVRDDLALLPPEVVQNESSAFRMINYLERYCESKSSNEAGGAAAAYDQAYTHNIDSNHNFSQSNHTAYTNYMQNSNAESHMSNHNTNNYQLQHQPTLDHHQQSTLNDYSQKASNSTTNYTNNQKMKKRESKLKRTQCNLM